MEIEHSVTINSDIDTVWDIFTDLTCWRDWSSVLGESSSDHDRLTKGKRFKFCLRPFVLPLYVEPIVEEIIPGKRIVWTGEKYGIKARHEFIFTKSKNSIHVLSREIFTAHAFKKFLFQVPGKKLHKLSIQMLHELKEAAEKIAV